MLVLVMKNMINNTKYTVQESHTYPHYKSFHVHQCFHYIPRLVYQQFFFLHLQFL